MLELFVDAEAPLSSSEVARRRRIPRTTALRILLTLAEQGMLARSGNGFEPGGKLFRLGIRALSSLRLRQFAQAPGAVIDLHCSAAGKVLLAYTLRAQLPSLVAHGLAVQTPHTLTTLSELEGHTDWVGSEVYNERLGLARAETVKRYLMQHLGVPGERISVVSYGERAPLAPNTTREGRAQNRRVVIKSGGGS